MRRFFQETHARVARVTRPVSLQTSQGEYPMIPSVRVLRGTPEKLRLDQRQTFGGMFADRLGQFFVEELRARGTMHLRQCGKAGVPDPSSCGQMRQIAEGLLTVVRDTLMYLNRLPGGKGNIRARHLAPSSRVQGSSSGAILSKNPPKTAQENAQRRSNSKGLRRGCGTTRCSSGRKWSPQRDSNPCRGLEKPVS
jgi:hypothetical protein